MKTKQWTRGGDEPALLRATRDRLGIKELKRWLGVDGGILPEERWRRLPKVSPKMKQMSDG